jgi:hypothetical protein
VRNVLLLGLVVTLSVFAEAPVAKVTSTDTFSLHGAAVNPAGVPSWPMMVGDDIATAAVPAVIEFRDGLRVTLAKNSRAKVEKSEDGVLLRLVAGSLQFVRGASSVKILNNTKPVPGASGVVSTPGPPDNQGSYRLTARRPPPPPISK